MNFTPAQPCIATTDFHGFHRIVIVSRDSSLPALGQLDPFHIRVVERVGEAASVRYEEIGGGVARLNANVCCAAPKTISARQRDAEQ
jgi:hypothetical protein